MSDNTFVARRLLGIFIFGAAFACNALVGWDELPQVSKDADTKDAKAPKPTKDTGGTEPDEEDSGEPTPTGPFCDPTKAWGAPALVDQFDANRVARDAIVSPSLLEAFYFAGTSGVFTLRRSARATRDDRWGPPEDVTLNPAPLTGMTLSNGGRRLVYHACVGTSPQVCKNYYTTRQQAEGTFNPTAQVFNNALAETDLFVVGSDDIAYFTTLGSDAANGFTSIHTAPVVNNQVNMNLKAEVDGLHVRGFTDDRPVLNESQTNLYFTSNRTPTLGSQDQWVARRASKTAPFGTPSTVPELSGPGPDRLTWVSDDDCEAFIARSDHVYYTRRPQ